MTLTNQKLSEESLYMNLFSMNGWCSCSLWCFSFNNLHFESAHLFPSGCLPEIWISFHFIVRCPHGLTLAGIFAAWFSRISLFRCRTHRRLSCCDFAYQEERWTVRQPYLSQDTATPRTSDQVGHTQCGQKAVERPSGMWCSSCTRWASQGGNGTLVPEPCAAAWGSCSGRRWSSGAPLGSLPPAWGCRTGGASREGEAGSQGSRTSAPSPHPGCPLRPTRMWALYVNVSSLFLVMSSSLSKRKSVRSFLARWRRKVPSSTSSP